MPWAAASIVGNTGMPSASISRTASSGPRLIDDQQPVGPAACAPRRARRGRRRAAGGCRATATGTARSRRCRARPARPTASSAGSPAGSTSAPWRPPDCAAASGTTDRMRAWVASASAGSDSPARRIASAISMPKPPEAASSVTRVALRQAVRHSSEAAWPMSSSFRRWHPQRPVATEDRVEHRVRAGERAGVRAAAAWPRSVAPIFSTITGLRCSRAMASASISRRALRQVSMQHRITRGRRVARQRGDRRRRCRRRTRCRSAMKRLTPMPRWATSAW